MISSHNKQYFKVVSSSRRSSFLARRHEEHLCLLCAVLRNVAARGVFNGG